jgi:para-nitrobenzyl esterase
LSVSLHLVSPGSAGLFDRAIIQSGAATYRWPDRLEAEAQGARLAAALGCTDEAQVLPCLRSRSRDQILLALPVGQDQIVEGQRVQWLPNIDGLELPDQPKQLYESGAFSRVPVVIGTNRDEGWPFVDRSFPGDVTIDQYEAILAGEFAADADTIQAKYSVDRFASPKDALARLVGDVEFVCEARRLARSIARTKTPIYLYSFEYEVDAVAPDRVIHGLESNLLFGNNFGPPSNYVLVAPDLALFDVMSGYWTRFAATGNPNLSSVNPAVSVAGAVRWPRFRHSRARTPRGNQHSFAAHVRAVGRRGADGHLVLDSNTRQDRHLRRAACDFWEPYSFRSVVGSVPASQP